MTYTKEELAEFTKRELIAILKQEGDTHIKKKRITKCNKDVLIDFIFETYCIETKPLNEDSIDVCIYLIFTYKYLYKYCYVINM